MENHNLKIGRFSADELVDQFGTPLYVYDLNRLRENYRAVWKNIQYRPMDVHYAVMANDRSPLLDTLLSERAHLQVNSRRELQKALDLGYRIGRISLTTTNLSLADLRYFASHGIMINFDSVEEIFKYGTLLRDVKQAKRDIGIRLYMGDCALTENATNLPLPGRARVGISQENFGDLDEICRQFGLRIIGLHGYLGSNMRNWQSFRQIGLEFAKCATRFKDLTYLNFGGGFGLDMQGGELTFDWQRFGRMAGKIIEVLNRHLDRTLVLKLEPGRALSGDCGVLLCRVTNIKQCNDWVSLGVDTGFGHFARPLLYDANGAGYHPVVIANKMDQLPTKSYTVFGNSVLQNDLIASERQLPEAEEGDILAILKAGAYGAVMGSGFPGRDPVREIALDGKKIIEINELSM